VVIEPHRALILDFKTDKVDTDEAFQARINGYRPQLTTYREVLHRMTGLPMEAIECQLLFTHRRELVSV
jgi:ATP-dependent exoDNAse (exonuclease V) beta subunit